jgi:hypothetical protein
MARDIFIKLNRCHFCGRPGFVVWDTDLSSCGHEVCESLAFAEVRRRHGNGSDLPEKKLAKALLGALDTFEDELRLDHDAELVDDVEAHEIDEYEREQTAHVLSELHELERRYPPPRSAPRPRRPTLA